MGRLNHGRAGTEGGKTRVGWRAAADDRANIANWSIRVLANEMEYLKRYLLTLSLVMSHIFIFSLHRLLSTHDYSLAK